MREKYLLPLRDLVGLPLGEVFEKETRYSADPAKAG
jgi:hypothetical protein